MTLSTRLTKLEQTGAISVDWTYPVGNRSAQPDMNPGSRNTQKATRVRSNIDTRIWSTLDTENRNHDETPEQPIYVTFVFVEINCSCTEIFTLNMPNLCKDDNVFFKD